MDLGESIRSGTKWLLAGNVGNQLLQFAFGVVLARLLLPADFGMLVTIQIFTGIAGFVAGGGMGQALVQAKTVEARDYQVVFTVAPWFAAWFSEPLYQELLRVSALSFLLRPFANIPSSILHREMRFREKATVNVATMLSGGAASIAMALTGLEVWSLILGGLLGTLVSVVILWAITRWRPALRLDKGVLRRLGKYGVKLSANDILVYSKAQTCNFILTRVAGPAMVGLYNKADSLNTLPIRLIYNSVYQTVFRALATVQEKQDLSRYIFYRSITLTTVYSLPLYVAMWWLAEPFIVTVYGANWQAAAAPLEVLAVSGLFLFGNPSGAVIAARDRLGREIWINLESWAILAVAAYIGSHWGLTGVAWAMVLNRLYSSMRLYGVARRCVGGGYGDLLRALAPGVSLCALLFVTALIADRTVFGALRADHGALYLIGMLAVGGMSYAAALLYAPIAALAGEALRWRSALGLQRKA